METNKKSKKLIAFIIIIVAIILWLLFSGGNGNGNSEKIVVERGSISEVVRVTGKVVPTNDANLGFEISGIVNRIYFDVGDSVYAGQSIVSLDVDQPYADLQSAQAQLQADQANLQDLLNGTRPEEIAISEAKLDSNRAKLVDAKAQLLDKISDAYTKADDAVTHKVDQFIDNPRTNPELTFNISDFSLERRIESARKVLNGSLDALLNLSIIGSTENVLDSSSQAKSHVNDVNAFLNDVAQAINALSGNSNLSQTTIDGYRTDVLTARSNVNTALANILSAEEKVRTAESNVIIAQEDLALLKAGSTEQQIEVARANVQKSEAAVLSARVQINKAVITSPINGILTKQDAEIGETVQANQTIVSVISGGDLELEAQIPEVDIGRVLVGNQVKVTIDAFGDQEFMGTVSYIDPAETIIDGVVNFKSNVVFENVPENLRSGLTSNLFIQTNSKEDALIVPQYVIIERDEGTFVLKDVNGEKIETQVELGLRGSGGVIEVLSGISEGDSLYNVGLRSN